VILGVLPVKEFDVTITEKLQITVTVEAENRADAERLVAEQYQAGDHVLDVDNFTDVEFEANEGREAAEKAAENKLDVLLVEPGKRPQMVSIDPGLESLQQAVGGYIQAIYPYEDPVAIVCDEEGKINGSQLNRALRDDSGEIYDIIAGKFLVCGLGEENFESLPENLRGKYEDLFHQPEAFLKMGNRVMAIPTDPLESATKKAKPSLGAEL
jgi:hypothetical protein